MKRIFKFLAFIVISTLLISKVAFAQSKLTVNNARYGFQFLDGISLGKSEESSIDLFNTGTEPVIISSIEVTGEGFSIGSSRTGYIISRGDSIIGVVYDELGEAYNQWRIKSDTFWFNPPHKAPITIEPMKHYPLPIKFTPTMAGGTYSGYLKLKHNGRECNFGSPTATIPLGGHGLPIGTPDLAINRNITSSTNFGEVKVGSSQQKFVKLENIGTGTLVISEIYIAEYISALSIEKSKAYRLPNNETTITIEPDSAYNLLIEFTPTVVRTYFHILKLNHNGGNPVYHYPFYGIGIKADEDNNNQNNIVSVDEPAELPTEYSLSQNYPNPFNPTTKIQYSLPEVSYVRLSVYNNMGQEVMQLVNENQSAGKYIVDFNAKNLPSGIYFYRLQAGKYNSTQKMMLIK